MKAKVHIATFKKGSTSGSVIPIGIYTVEITIKAEQKTKYAGCHSGELITEVVPVITICNHRFILETPKHWDTPGEFDYSVIVPYELGELLKNQTCPCCGTTVLFS